MRMDGGTPPECIYSVVVPKWCRASLVGARERNSDGVPVLDIVYVLVAVAAFAVIGFVAWGVEKL
jgi:hypothetical protein